VTTGAGDLAAAGAEPVLLIDGEPIRHGRLPDGSYFLYEYAYDWRDDLADVARSFVDHQEAVAELGRDPKPGAEG
jgi:hypothetical protein